jgi:hypothetical protein
VLSLYYRSIGYLIRVLTNSFLILLIVFEFIFIFKLKNFPIFLELTINVLEIHILRAKSITEICTSKNSKVSFK